MTSPTSLAPEPPKSAYPLLPDVYSPYVAAYNAAVIGIENVADLERAVKALSAKPHVPVVFTLSPPPNPADGCHYPLAALCGAAVNLSIDLDGELECVLLARPVLKNRPRDWKPTLRAVVNADQICFLELVSQPVSFSKGD